MTLQRTLRRAQESVTGRVALTALPGIVTGCLFPNLPDRLQRVSAGLPGCTLDFALQRLVECSTFETEQVQLVVLQ